VKSEKELLLDFMQVICCDNYCFFKLRNGEDCCGIIKLANNNFLQFFSNGNDVLKDHDYERHYKWDKLSQEEYLQFILIPLQDIDTSNLYYWNKESSCFINPQWSVEQKCWIHHETKPGSIPLPTNFFKSLQDDKVLKQVGYWQSVANPYLPHPKHFVKSGWRESEHSKIMAYLRSGHEYCSSMGYSYCRFDCFCLTNNFDNLSQLEKNEWINGITSMGTRDLTDGEWVWPEGLTHYVEKHHICLPDAFIATMEKNSWFFPLQVGFQDFSQVGVSPSYWIDWSIEYFKAKQQ
jgi:hypothetical protein